MLQPVVRRTWAPQGQTPVQKSWDRRDRLSVVSALSLSPRRRRLGLYFALQGRNITHQDVEGFVAGLVSCLCHRIILVIDRWSVHRAAAKRLLRRFTRRLCIEWLPSYAPELNPDEQVWTRAKYVDMANFIPDDVDDLKQAIHKSLGHTSTRQDLLRSFFRCAKLKI